MKKLVTLSISISDTSISTALVEHVQAKKGTSEASKPIVRTYRTKSINPEHKEITSEYLQKRLAVLLRSVAKDTRYNDVVKAGLSVDDIKKITVSLSAPWFEGKTIISHFNEAKDFKVTDQILKKALETEIKSISGTDKNEIAVLESTILSSTLNGYAVSDPLGKTARNLTLFGYVSYAKQNTKNTITEVMDSFFHDAGEIIIKSEPTILLKAAVNEAEYIGFSKDYAIIRVNEILTHIQIVKNDHIRELGTVPIGLNALLTDISNASKVTKEVSLNVLKLYVNNKLEPNFKAEIEKIIYAALDKWRAAVKDFGMITLSSGRFPSQVFLSSPSIISHIFKEYLLRDNYLDLTMSEEKLHIEILDRSTLNSFIDIDPSIKEDPGFLTKLNAML